MAGSRQKSEVGVPSIQVYDLDPDSATKSNMSAKERKSLAGAPSLRALSMISPIKEGTGPALNASQQQERIHSEQKSGA